MDSEPSWNVPDFQAIYQEVLPQDSELELFAGNLLRDSNNSGRWRKNLAGKIIAGKALERCVQIMKGGLIKLKIKNLSSFMWLKHRLQRRKASYKQGEKQNFCWRHLWEKIIVMDFESGEEVSICFINREVIWSSLPSRNVTQEVLYLDKTEEHNNKSKEQGAGEWWDGWMGLRGTSS